MKRVKRNRSPKEGLTKPSNPNPQKAGQAALKTSNSSHPAHLMDQSSDDSDAEVEQFTKLFMKKADSISHKTSDQVDSDSSEAEEEIDYRRARNRMSPSEDSELNDSDSHGSSSDEESNPQSTTKGPIRKSSNALQADSGSEESDGEDYNRARNRMSPSQESDNDEDDMDDDDIKRARNRMSPSEESESDDDNSHDEESSSGEDEEVSSEENNSDDQHEGTGSEDMTSDEEESEKQPNIDALRKELADVPFEDLQMLKQKIGVKAFNHAMHGIRGGGRGSFKRANKNRPMEMSSKRPVSRHRDIVSVKKKVVRDPRFEDTSGRYDETFFKHAYGFLSDIKEREKQTLMKKLRKEKDEDKKAQIQYLLKRMAQHETADQNKEKQKIQRQAIKKKEQELVQQGKTPYYLKKGDRRKLELAEKFRELKKSGKLDKYLAKRRKKNAKKEKRKLPGSKSVFT